MLNQNAISGVLYYKVQNLTTSDSSIKNDGHYSFAITASRKTCVKKLYTLLVVRYKLTGSGEERYVYSNLLAIDNAVSVTLDGNTDTVTDLRIKQVDQTVFNTEYTYGGDAIDNLNWTDIISKLNHGTSGSSDTQ